MATYQYSRLPKGRHFRLLQIVHDDVGSIDAATGSAPRPEIVLELKTFPLDQAPPYWALSYTWGPPRLGPKGEEPDPASQPSVTVDCDGQPMQIGQNLHDFLRLSRDGAFFVSPRSAVAADAITSAGPFRLPPKSPEGGVGDARTAYLWVDAVCIDQENLEELSHQVGQMSAIYTLSKRVLIWLGCQMPSDEAAWAFETFLPGLLGLFDRNPSAIRRGTLDLEDGEVADALGAEACARWRNAYPELFGFLARTRWFGRGWIVQEALLKSQSGAWNRTMLCGSGSLHFDHFMGLMWLLALETRFGSTFELQQKMAAHDPEGPEMWAKPPSPIDTIDTLRRVGRILYKESSEAMTKWQRVLKLVVNMGRSSFANPRDRVFGCLGLIEAIVPKSDLGPISPDYTLSTVEVFTALARLLYENVHELEFLFSLTGSDPPSTSGLPSWVPDIARVTERRGFIYLGVRANESGGFNASKLFPVPQSQVKVDGKVLVLSGARLGIVGELVPPLKPRSFSAEWLVQYCEQDDVYRPTGQKRPEAVMLALSLDNAWLRRSGSQGGRNPDDTTDHVASTAKEWYLKVTAIQLRRNYHPKTILGPLAAAARRHPDWLPTFAEILPVAKSMPDAGADDAMLASLRSNAWDQQIKTFGTGRQLLLTDDGLLCYGPEGAKCGDEVWIVRGSRVPVLLRKATSGDEYRLIGETYVHGYMYGEAMTEAFEQHIAPVRIV